MSALSLKEAVYGAKFPLIGAHRGASLLYPENTMVAFQAAVEQGADFLELDVHLTRDGIPVVIHDETIDRTTVGSGLVENLTYDQIKRAGPVPSLVDVFIAYGRLVYLNIELKTSHDNQLLVEKVLFLLAQHALEDRIILSSFDHSLLRHVRFQNSQVLTGLLYENVLTDAIAVAKELGVSAIHPYYRFVNRLLVASCRAAGLLLFPWTIDAARHLRYLAAVGVTGIITNKPDYAANLLMNCAKYQQA